MDAFKQHLHQWLQRESALIPAPTPLLVLAALLITGFIFAQLARKTRIPVVTGQILGGVCLGHYVLKLFPEAAYASFTPITDFALGFIGLTIGSHLDFHRLHNAGRRILWIAFTDAVLTPTLTFLALTHFASVSFPVAILVSAIAVATAPGSTIHVIRERRARGVFTKTLLAVVALNNVLTIIMFYTAYYYIHHQNPNSMFPRLEIMTRSTLLFLESVAIGVAVGCAVIYFTEKRKTTLSFLAVVILAVVVTVGSSGALHLSGLLASLVLGMVITNCSRHSNRLFGAFRDIETEIFSLFFVLAGTHVDFYVIYAASTAGLTLIISRAAGKTLGPLLGAMAGGATPSVRRGMTISMYPIAGIAIGLMLLCESIPFLADVNDQISAIVLTAVVVNELIGPIFTGMAVRRTGEENQNRMRLLDFLQEEFIIVDLEALSKWQALDRLSEFLHHTHQCRNVTVEQLKKSVAERERMVSTGIGDGLAIPHAIVEGGPKIQGVIGVSRQGIEFEAADDKPVHIIFLIATPEDSYDMHLNVLASIARIFGHHPHISGQIVNAKSPAEVFEILHAEEVEALNPFFEA